MDFEERMKKLAEQHKAFMERHEAHMREMGELKTASEQTGERIRALLRIAEIREQKLKHPEGGE